MDPEDIFMGVKGGVSQDFPDEHHWRIIDWIISGRRPFLVLNYRYSSPLMIN